MHVRDVWPRAHLEQLFLMFLTQSLNPKTNHLKKYPNGRIKCQKSARLGAHVQRGYLPRLLVVIPLHGLGVLPRLHAPEV